MATKIYTRTGDDGTTGLFGGGRVAKFDLRVEAYGTVDELNSAIGVVCAHEQTPDELKSVLLELSSLLFVAGGDLATPRSATLRFTLPRITAEHTLWLEQWIDRWEAELEPLKNFILPTGCMPATLLHLARTICRRAERRVVALAQHEDLGEALLPFLNRCSDFLFVAARLANKRCGVEDVTWKPVGST